MIWGPGFGENLDCNKHAVLKKLVSDLQKGKSFLLQSVSGYQRAVGLLSSQLLLRPLTISVYSSGICSVGLLFLSKIISHAFLKFCGLPKCSGWKAWVPGRLLGPSQVKIDCVACTRCASSTISCMIAHKLKAWAGSFTLWQMGRREKCMFRKKKGWMLQVNRGTVTSS